MMQIVRFNYPEGKQVFRDLLTSDTPSWIGRNGGSDTDFVEHWDGKTFAHPNVDLMRRLNGYYDRSSSVENLHRFRQMYLDSSRATDLCTVHMSSIFGKSLDGEEYAVNKLKYVYGVDRIMCWRFIENCTYFLESFQEWGEGKKILVVSPFSRSINHQTSADRVGNLHKPQFQFPNCTFVTLDTPITYNTNSWECDSRRDTEAENWFDTAEQIFEKIKAVAFDVAWLSCGSYAMYLGPRIKKELGKHSIYVGGMVNLFFNLYNFRYSSTGHDTAVINPSYQIESLENEELFTEKNLKAFPYSEGLRAYLGKKEI